MPHPAHATLAAALDAGDRLLAALTAEDLEGAADALAERESVLATLAALPRPESMPQALVVRFHAQDTRLARLLKAKTTAAASALAGVVQTGAARAAYASASAPGARLDTAPR